MAAVIYTHTHIDHYGGVRGVVDAEDVASGAVPIVAPGTIASFDKHAIGENVVCGNVMSRRGSWGFGNLLPKGERDTLSNGIGTLVIARWTGQLDRERLHQVLKQPELVDTDALLKQHGSPAH